MEPQSKCIVNICQNDETRSEHWYLSMLNTKHYQIIPALSSICGSGIYQFFLKSSSLPIIGDTSMSLAIHCSGIPKNSNHTLDMLFWTELQFSVSGPGFFAPKKRAQIKFTDMYIYIWYAERTWPCHLHSRNATLPEIRQSKSGFWGCCDEMSLQWSSGTSSGLGIRFSQGPSVAWNAYQSGECWVSTIFQRDQYIGL